MWRQAVTAAFALLAVDQAVISSNPAESCPELLGDMLVSAISALDAAGAFAVGQIGHGLEAVFCFRREHVDSIPWRRSGKRAENPIALTSCALSKAEPFVHDVGSPIKTIIICILIINRIIFVY